MLAEIVCSTYKELASCFVHLNASDPPWHVSIGCAIVCAGSNQAVVLSDD